MKREGMRRGAAWRGGEGGNENDHALEEQKDWNEIEYKQNRIKENVLKWLTTEKNI